MHNISVYAVFVIVFFAQNTFGQESVPDEPPPARETEAPPPRADTCPYALSLHPCFGFIYGRAEEIVYPPSSEFKAELLSQLLWDMKPVFYYGLRTDFSQIKTTEKHGLFSSLSLKFGIPALSGKIVDRDWLSIENTDLTNYSIHDNFTREMFLLDFSAGYAFPFLRVMILKAYVNVSYMNFRFSGFDGHGIYARSKGKNTYYPIGDNPDTETELFKGKKVINYTQVWLSVAPGVSFGYYFFENFCAELSFRITPLILCSDLDEHLTTKTQFRDYMQGGLLIEPGATLSFACNDWIALSLEFSWKYINGTKGDTFMRPYGKGDYFQSGTAGAGLSVLDTGFFFRIRL
jgi:outer membrane protease